MTLRTTTISRRSWGWAGRTSGLMALFFALFAACAAGQILPIGTDKLFDQPVYYALAPGTFINSTGGATFGDFNADGLIDIAFGSTSGELGVSMALTNSSFGAAVITQVTSGGLWNDLKILSAGDFDLDGDLDIVGHDLAGIRLMLNDGSGAFTALPAYLPSVGYWLINGITAFDADGDGAMDVVLGDNTLAGARFHIISYSAASGSLYTKSLTVFASNLQVAEHVGGADVDGDGVKDIVSIVLDGSVFPNLNELHVYGMSGTGGLTQKFLGTQASMGVPYMVGLFLGDFDNNGVEDVIVQTNYTMKLLYGVAGGSLSAGPATAPYAFPGVLPYYGIFGGAWFGQPASKCLARDFDFDGIVEIGVPGSAEWVVLRTPHVGTSMNSSSQLYFGANNPGTYQQQLRGHSTYAKDLDGDGDLDVIDVTDRTSIDLGIPGYFQHFAHYGILWNRTNRHPGCPSTSTGLAPTLTIGTPVPGNAAWTMSIAGALPGAPVVFALSLEPGGSTWGACNLWLDASPSTLFLPNGSVGFSTADATGLAAITLSIPPAVGPAAWFKNREFIGVALTADPQGSLTLGGTNYTSTPTRGVLVW